MDIIFEILFEIILEGSWELSTTKSFKVPLPLRILAVLLTVGLYGGLCGILFIEGIKNRQIILIIIAVFLAVMTLALVIKKFREFKNKKLGEKDI